MEKNTYYVRVGTGEVLQDRSAFEWEYEIQATEEQIKRLQELLNHTGSASDHSFWRSLTPYPYHHDEENDQYDDTLESVYQILHELGDAETKEHIESMGVLK
ncbi:MAG TPA: hydrolase [Bacillales bacterium]